MLSKQIHSVRHPMIGKMIALARPALPKKTPEKVTSPPTPYLC